jgi:hypothetical protein
MRAIILWLGEKALDLSKDLLLLFYLLMVIIWKTTNKIKRANKPSYVIWLQNTR